MADKDVSPADWFVGGALQRQLSEQFLAGVGLTQTGVSDDLGAGFSDSTEAEVYVKYDVTSNFNLTPSVQWVRNPGFDDTETVVDQDNWIFGLRVGLSM
jgi:carbohydrate-selective porin OprB